MSLTQRFAFFTPTVGSTHRRRSRCLERGRGGGKEKEGDVTIAENVREEGMVRGLDKRRDLGFSGR